MYYKSIFIFIFSLFILTSCAKKETSENKFVGTWLRIGDDLQGSRIKIKQEENKFIGINLDRNLSNELDKKWEELSLINNDHLEGISSGKRKITIEYSNKLLSVSEVTEKGSNVIERYIRLPTDIPKIYRSETFPEGEGTEGQFDIALYNNVGYVMSYVDGTEYAKAWFIINYDKSGNLDLKTFNSKTQYKLDDWSYLFRGKNLNDKILEGSLKLKEASWAYEKIKLKALNITLNGKWELEEWGEGPMHSVINLKQENEELTGSIEFYGSDIADMNKYEIQSAIIRGNEITLETKPVGDFSMQYIFSGVLNPNNNIIGKLIHLSDQKVDYTSKINTFEYKDRNKSEELVDDKIDLISKKVEEYTESKALVDVENVIRVEVESKYNPLIYSNIDRLVLTSLQDDLVIQDIIANRGKCKVDKSTIRYSGGNIQALKLPLTLDFSESTKFTLRNGCKNLLEVELHTNYGAAVWRFSG